MEQLVATQTPLGENTKVLCKGHATENRRTSLNQDELFGFSPDLIRSCAVVAAKVVLGVRVNLRWIKSACINLRDPNQLFHSLYFPPHYSMCFLCSIINLQHHLRENTIPLLISAFIKCLCAKEQLVQVVLGLLPAGSFLWGW